MARKYFDEDIICSNQYEKIDMELIEMINELDSKIEKRMNKYEIGASLDEIFELLRRSNKYIDETMPWILAKENNTDRLMIVIYNLLESIRVSASLLYPFLPSTSDEIFRQLNISDKSPKYSYENNYIVESPHPLFMRIDKNGVK